MLVPAHMTATLVEVIAVAAGTFWVFAQEPQDDFQNQISGASSPCGGGPTSVLRGRHMGSVVKKRRKRMAKKKHRKLLRKTRVQRRRLGK